MNAIYKKLAEKLDRIPNGFPKTESGVELKLLAKLFSPEEAEIACNLSLEPKSTKIVAEQIGWDKEEAFSVLKRMVKKGLIELEKINGELCFKLLPFIVGFYEYQNARIDKEFAELFEQYYSEALYKIMDMKPSLHRVIPVEKTIPVSIDILPYEKASTYIENARSWGALNCICRVQKKLIGKGCDHTIENCLVFSSREHRYDKTDAIRSITKKEALEILDQAAKEGLVHSVNNVQEEVKYICNCCTCSCGILQGIKYSNFNSIAHSDFYAIVDEELCSGCATCMDRCQFNAIEIKNNISKVNKIVCFGCGLCVSTCSTGALLLEQKENSEINSPPYSEKEWRESRQKNRN